MTSRTAHAVRDVTPSRTVRAQTRDSGDFRGQCPTQLGKGSWPRAPKDRPAQLLRGSGIFGAHASLLISTAKDHPRQATPPGPSAQGKGALRASASTLQFFCQPRQPERSAIKRMCKDCPCCGGACIPLKSCDMGFARQPGGIAGMRKPGREVSEEASEAAGTGSALTWPGVAADPLSNEPTSNKRRNCAASVLRPRSLQSLHLIAKG